MAAHTPGPWVITVGSRDEVIVTSPHDPEGIDDDVCLVYGGNDEERSIREANARLIAAAPKLLGAMQGKDIDPDVTPIEWISSLVTDVRAALDSEQWEYEDVASLRECLWNIETFLTAARAAVAEAVGA